MNSIYCCACSAIAAPKCLEVGNKTAISAVRGIHLKFDGFCRQHANAAIVDVFFIRLFRTKMRASRDFL